MNIKLTAFALLATLALGAAPAQAFFAKSTKDFVNDTAIANKFEIDSSQMALKTSPTPDVKDFAQQMVDDHTKAGESFKTALSSVKKPATAPEALDDKHQKMMDKLAKLQGADFDKEYIKMQQDAHKDAVKMFNDYSKRGDDPSLKSFAAETLPVLQHHKDMIDALKKNYSKKKQAAR